MGGKCAYAKIQWLLRKNLSENMKCLIQKFKSSLKRKCVKLLHSLYILHGQKAFKWQTYDFIEHWQIKPLLYITQKPLDPSQTCPGTCNYPDYLWHWSFIQPLTKLKGLKGLEEALCITSARHTLLLRAHRLLVRRPFHWIKLNWGVEIILP